MSAEVLTQKDQEGQPLTAQRMYTLSATTVLSSHPSRGIRTITPILGAIHLHYLVTITALRIVPYSPEFVLHELHTALPTEHVVFHPSGHQTLDA